MLQKELNLQQEQPRKEKNLSEKSVRTRVPTMKLTSQKIQTEWEEGIIVDLSVPLPQQDSVKTVPDLGQCLDWIGSQSLPSPALHFWAGEMMLGDGKYLTLQLHPPAPPRAAAFRLVMLDHSLKPPCCAFALTVSSAPKSFPFFIQHPFV